MSLSINGKLLQLANEYYINFGSYEQKKIEFTTPEQVRAEYIELSVESLAPTVQIPAEDVKAYYEANSNRSTSAAAEAGTSLSRPCSRQSKKYVASTGPASVPLRARAKPIAKLTPKGGFQPKRGIVLSSDQHPGKPSYATAELTWGLVIAAMRRIPQEVASLKAGRWQSSVGTGLRGR